MGALPRPAVSAGPHRELVEALHDLHHRAGWPSLRRIAAQAGVSHTTVSHVLSDPRVPAWDNLRAVVETLGGDADEFHRHWLAVTTPDPDTVEEVPLVGRHDELAAGHRFFRDHGRLLLLAGEAGAGKTRLLGAVSGNSQRLVLGARCVPMSQGEPLMPLAAALRVAHRIDQGRWVSEALEALPEFVGPALAPLLPELVTTQPPSDAGAAFARHRLFTAACQLLAELDRRRSCLLQLDDLHWADDSTRDFVTFAVGYDDGPPLVVTWRLSDPETAPAAESWRSRTTGQPKVTTMPVGPLDEADSLQQLRALGVADAAEAAALLQRSGGLPLFTEHLARSRDQDDLPDRLAELLSQRLRGLPVDGRRVSDSLAVLDRPVEAESLPDLAGLSRDRVTSGLRQLTDRHLLQRTAGTVALNHPLLAQAARDDLLPTELVDHHRRIATTLEEQPHTAPSEIAVHWRAAGVPDRGLPWEVRAALAAEERWALVEAADHWQRALDTWPAALATLDDPPLARSTAQLHALRALFSFDRAAAVPLADRAMAELGPGRVPDDAALLAQAAEIANANDNTDLAITLIDDAVRLLESDPPSRTFAAVLDAQEFILSGAGREREAMQVGIRLAEVCARIDDDWLRWNSSINLAHYALDKGDLDAMVEHLAASAPDPERLAEDPAAAALLSVQRTSLLLSADAGAGQVCAAGIPTLRAAEAWGFDSVVGDLLRGNVAEALRLAGSLLEATKLVDHVAAEPPDPRHAGSHGELAMLDLALGRTEEAHARAVVVAELPTSHLANRFSAVGGLVDILLWSKHPREALDRSLELLATTDTSDSGSYAARMFTFAARATADLTEPGSRSAAHLGARLRGVVDHSQVDPFAPLDTIPSRTALRAQWLGELGRLDGKPDVQSWSTAIKVWDDLERPFDAAYCRWRAAEACIALGQATAAGRLLRRGLKDARQHVPLRDALTATLRDLSGS